MNSKSFRYASLAMNILERLLGSRFTVSGIEKIPKKPVLFVANHFTRSETFFVPYIINKITSRHTRCLADSKIFVGAFGKFLRSVGTVSTKDPNRDNIIIGDLISGSYDWMIYPEGSMIKSKEISFDGIFTSSTPYRIGPVRTGSSVLALKSELFRQDLVNAYLGNNQNIINDYKKNYGFDFDISKIQNLNTYIVPVNITYYPIRPGENKIKNMALKLIKNLPSQISEELEIEGNILMDSIIDINFGDPINILDYIGSTKLIISKIPIINYETKNNFVIKYYRSKLTNDFMGKVYLNIQINFDHLFIASLINFNNNKIQIDQLKRIIYYSAVLLAKTGKYRMHSLLLEENIFTIFNDEKFTQFDDVFDLALKQNIIGKTSESEVQIYKTQLNKKLDFHNIRIENTLLVIFREFDILESANSVVKRVCKINDEELKNLVFENICKVDIKNYKNDYLKYFDENFSKNQLVGSPSLNVSFQSNYAVILVHGYKSAPKEMQDLANFFNDNQISTYNVRLKGHGTAPINLQNCEWIDWYQSLQRGYCALSNKFENLVIIGFSTGGLLSLVSASQKNIKKSKLKAVISINSALKLLDIKAKMVPGINLWNELLQKFNIEAGQFQYVDDTPENPHINYSRNYLKGVYELEKLMNVCKDNLYKIIQPTLVIQAKGDPVVNPISGKLIYDMINSNNKKLTLLDFNNHIIVNSENKLIVFEEIMDFLKKIMLK
ncbi:MAG: serine aminopeptidase domain-containing protein [Alphaproteobacteria bacterium]